MASGCIAASCRAIDHDDGWAVTVSKHAAAINAAASFDAISMQMQHYPVGAAVPRHDKNEDSGSSREGITDRGEAAV